MGYERDELRQISGGNGYIPPGRVSSVCGCGIRVGAVVR